ncbi:MAG TPA: agmatine deiminase family protein, partial [Alphaproteobacteria bacterium]|nr:agmatine deiminase family protein [Alphaproteobacteria bacterium]
MTFIPPEWARHKAMWTAWPSAADLWLEDLAPAREEVAAMIRALAEGEPVKVLAGSGEPLESAKEALRGVADVIEQPFGDIWLRDTAPIFSSPTQANLFRFNGWGEKYVLEGDDQVGERIAHFAGAKAVRHDFILEGGSVDMDGNGLCLTTRQCLLNPNRNKGWDQEKAEAALKTALGAQKILWLDEGLVGDHTDGHIDNIARFVAPGKVVCQSASGADDPNAAILKRIEESLRAMTDGQGKKLDVVTLPSPGLVTDDEGEVRAASHMNFIIGNTCVVVPAYNNRAEAAVAALKALFPGRKVVAHAATAI